MRSKHFFNGLTKQREEKRLFQFLNGLDDHYSAQRSQSLLMHPLPSVEAACSLLQHKESKRQILDLNKVEYKSTALYSKQQTKPKVCNQCGTKGHVKEKCWTIIGYPSWNSKGKRFPQKKGGSFQKNKTKMVYEPKVATNADASKSKGA